MDSVAHKETGRVFDIIGRSARETQERPVIWRIKDVLSGQIREVRDGKMHTLYRKIDPSERIVPIEFAPLTVDSLAARLEELPVNLLVVGVSADADSYRGSYDYVALAPGTARAGDLARYVRGLVGDTRMPYKGDEPVTFTGETPVHAADWGETGPALVGISGTGAIITVQGYF